MIVLLLSFGSASGQEQEQSFTGFMDGIRANAVKGEVVYKRNDATFPLEPGLRLEPGDIIKTTSGTYVELLLQPGNYLRAGEDTELQIVNDKHDRMKFKLIRGTASFEILSPDYQRRFFKDYEERYLIRLIVPQTEVFITEFGIFRINATQSGQTELVVRKGSAIIKGQEVKEKRRAVVSGDNISITEIDAKLEDSFDKWARERAETLVRANKTLKKATLWSKQKDTKESTVVLPQTEGESDSSMIVSAKPGTVTFVEDGVEFSRVRDEWQELTENTELEAGDKLRTAAHSFTELGLFPDMHFRIGPSSEVLLEHLSNDAVSIKLVNGSAILDTVLFDSRDSPLITIAAGATTVTIAESGNFRLDQDAIMIRRGKVRFNERSIGSCRRIAAGVVSDCDEKRLDNLDYWSRYAGEGKYFWGVSMAGFLERSRRLRFRNNGFWFQNPEQLSYIFVPFTSEFFRSPFGGNYSTALTPRRRVNPGRLLEFPGSNSGPLPPSKPRKP